MSEIAKYEKMLKDNNAAIKKLTERGKQIAAVIKLIKSLESEDEPVDKFDPRDVAILGGDPSQ